MPSFMVASSRTGATPNHLAHFPKRKTRNYSPTRELPAPAHHVEEVVVVLRRLHLVEDELHRLDLVHRIEQLAQDPGLLQDFGLQQQLFTPGAALVDQDGRVDAL